MRSLLQQTLAVLFRIFSQTHVTGRENLPPRGPYLFATNHIGFLDPAFVFSQMQGQPVAGWAAEKYRNHLLFGPLLRTGGAIFIRRGEVDRSALQAAVDALRAGKIFGLAPEGTRSRTGGLIRARTGVAYLAYRAQVPIVPAAITGTQTAWGSWARLRRPVLTLRVGRPFRLPDLDHEARPEDLRRAADEVMCRIAALLPAEYRGIYADLPRTLELLRESALEAASASGA
jgi:1-acyl-sn-glycerol-3-phosphate acyltransferase